MMTEFLFILCFILICVILYLRSELKNKSNEIIKIENDVKKSDTYNSLLWKYRSIVEKLEIYESHIKEQKNISDELDAIYRHNSIMLNELTPYKQKYNEIKNFKDNYEFVFLDENMCIVTIKNKKALSLARKRYKTLIAEIASSMYEINNLPDDILKIINRNSDMLKMSVIEIGNYCITNKNYIINELAKDILLKECNKPLIKSFL